MDGNRKIMPYFNIFEKCTSLTDFNAKMGEETDKRIPNKRRTGEC